MFEILYQYISGETSICYDCIQYVSHILGKVSLDKYFLYRAGLVDYLFYYRIVESENRFNAVWAGPSSREHTAFPTQDAFAN